ncbi:MAG: hypothetical protein KDK33_11805, partial [Leptospiraceae bacterium]|nr:hypothetical protein [Leptospiraceae bacterium]
MRRIRYVSIALLGILGLSYCSLNDSRPVDAILPLVASSLTAEQQLGKELFFDTNLSQPSGQACGSCHNPTVAFTTPTAEMNNGITPGVFTSRTGPRNAPTASYAAYSPTPFFDDEAGTWVGGQFLDHRASSLEDQAKQPFLNAVEMANADRSSVVADVAAASYADDFRALYGSGIFSDTDRAYEKIAQALAAYERSSEVNPFSSKFDAYLAGRANLSAQELRGLALFRNPSKGNCEACHPSTGDSPVFTDFTNDNLGVPKNSSNPFYTVSATFNPDGAAFID